ncbi:hypothetical protein PGTUg99_000346 [Puccinia graminis f. sp. tritici]|uniref:Uncharacterized protein n=1 Tax=Puccinia graminis f. sp. tritici TaxID=56615 RepID=A0A5B0NA96_PUCGR|nr:hypothetical protein PGTUg99_000346 [Puccinia graminis f. sp. tritici]
MRHLINVVDISHDEGRASELKKICINRDTTHHSATSRLPAMTAEESAKAKDNTYLGIEGASQFRQIVKTNLTSQLPCCDRRPISDNL